MLLQDDKPSAAMQDVQSKTTPLNPHHYGDLDFILGFSGTSDKLQFYTLSVAGQVQPSCASRRIASCSAWRCGQAIMLCCDTVV